MSLSAISSGPTLGIFTMGVLLPWINARVCVGKQLNLELKASSRNFWLLLTLGDSWLMTQKQNKNTR